MTDTKSFYVPQNFPNHMRHWYGSGTPHKQDMYNKDRLNIWKILMKYSDSSKLNFSEDDNNRLESLGFEKLQVYLDRLVEAHNQIKNSSSTTQNLKQLSEGDSNE